MSQSARITVDVKVDQAVDGDLNTVKNSAALSKVLQLLNGTGTGQASKTFTDRRTIAGSATDSLDLTAVLLDAFGAAISFAAIKTIIISAATANGDNIEIGGNAAAFATFMGSATETIVVKPGGILVLTTGEGAGYAVTATTADILDITNADADPVQYEIVLIGI